MCILIVICSKSPNNILFECIDLLYKIQIKQDLLRYKICVIDSDSYEFSTYEKIHNCFPDVEIYYTKNKNYEYGAWKYALKLYPNYDIYFCIQDSTLIQKHIDLSIINDDNVYTWHNLSGYNLHISIKEKGIENLKTTDLKYESLIDLNFNLAYSNIFIVNNNIMKDIFNTFTVPPINKDGSCLYERNFGLYFIIKEKKSTNLNNHFIKFNGCRI